MPKHLDMSGDLYPLLVYEMLYRLSIPLGHIERLSKQDPRAAQYALLALRWSDSYSPR